MVTRNNLPQPNCDSDGKAENKQQRMVVWLIYRQFECQEEVIFIIFPCASENVSCQWTPVDPPERALHYTSLKQPPQFLGDLKTRLSIMLHLHEQDVKTLQGFQSPTSSMIIVLTIHLGEERQCDPDSRFSFNVSSTMVTAVQRPGTRKPNHRPSSHSHRVHHR